MFARTLQAKASLSRCSSIWNLTEATSMICTKRAAPCSQNPNDPETTQAEACTLHTWSYRMIVVRARSTSDETSAKCMLDSTCNLVLDSQGVDFSFHLFIFNSHLCTIVLAPGSTWYKVQPYASRFKVSCLVLRSSAMVDIRKCLQSCCACASYLIAWL